MEVDMTLRRVLALILVLLWTVGCSASTRTGIEVRVADHFSHDGLDSGDSLAGGVLTLLKGDAVVLEAVLDEDGVVVIEPDPGVYDVQVRFDSEQQPLCFWGTTEFGVEFPSSPIKLEVSYICPGG
jgi:hypothetical protein